MAGPTPHLSVFVSFLWLGACTATIHRGTCDTDANCSGGRCVEGVCRPACDGLMCAGTCCRPGELCENGACVADNPVAPAPCESGVRCGRELDTCCAAGEICYAIACTTPDEPCQQQSDCPPTQACEPDLGICIDREAMGTCEYRPPVGEFNPQIECRWAPPEDQVNPERNDVVMAPVVANLTDDNLDGHTDTFDTPDLVFTSYNLDDPQFPNKGCCNVHGTLRIASGRCNSDGTMATHASLSEPPIDNSGGIALGDLDGDGVAEIVAMTINEDGRPAGTVAFERISADGTAWAMRWHNPDYPTWNIHTRGGSQPALADLNGDGKPEVVVGNIVLSGVDGSLNWDGLATSAGAGGIGNNAFLGPVSTVADIDLDGDPEVLAGNTCYGPDGEVEWTYVYTTSNSNCGGHLPCDGFSAAANFDDDPEGEVVIVRLGEVHVLNHDGSLLETVSIPTDDCNNNESGPPTVADFDGDGRPEIGTAAADYYVVVDLDCLASPLPDGCAMPGVLWYVDNQDCSSRVTASSVFDFDGDGRAEAIYADEDTFRIFDGRTGDALFTDETHGSHTRLEMVVVADVDNDGNAEVIIAENASKNGTPGVEIWGDRADNWVYTRRIWNQHSYHVSNVTELATIPAVEPHSWEGANSFRQNVQGENLFWAPDLVIARAEADCRELGFVDISFDVVNIGSRLVGAGVAATVYFGSDVVETFRTTRPLLPGERERMTTHWPIPRTAWGTSFELRIVADNAGPGISEQNECEPDGENNNQVILPILCVVDEPPM